MKYNKDKVYTVAFYNVENFFDTVDDPLTNDDAYTPNGERKWSLIRYHNKLKKISSVIAQIGRKRSAYEPVLVGLVEVENTKVLEDLVHHKNLLDANYSFVHKSSQDKRGVDVALLYRNDCFELLHSKAYPLSFEEDGGEMGVSRDILVVSGRLNNELIHIIVNHWPSRREGEDKSDFKRNEAAKLVHDIIEDIKGGDSDPNIIIMGDFNDNPNDESISKYLMESYLFNPMIDLYKKGIGSLTFRGKWNLFDQIILTKSFLNNSLSEHRFIEARVFNKKWLRFYKGKKKGSPFRTYVGRWYKGGFSDHFPVYTYLYKEN